MPALRRARSSASHAPWVAAVLVLVLASAAGTGCGGCGSSSSRGAGGQLEAGAAAASSSLAAASVFVPMPSSTPPPPPPPPPPPAPPSIAGRFVWHDLLTTDVPAAVAFYGSVVGWRTAPHPADPSYTVWMTGLGPVGGVSKIQRDASGKTPKPYWASTISVDDVDAAAALAGKQGGRVLFDAWDVPGMGRFATLLDPGGIPFGIGKLAMPALGGPLPGEFFWNELVTGDSAAALAFFGRVFGWQPLAPEKTAPYFILGRDGMPLGGMRVDPAFRQNAWVYYVQVQDLDGAVARARARGAKVLWGPAPVPDGRVAQLTDPQGAPFALHTSAPPPAGAPPPGAPPP